MKKIFLSLLFLFSFMAFSNLKAISYSHNFTTQDYDSNFFNIKENSFNTTQGSFTYNGITYTRIYKLNSKGEITFITTKKSTLKLIIGGRNSGSIVGVNDYEIFIGKDKGYFEVELEQGSYTVKRLEKECYIYYIEVEYDEDGTTEEYVDVLVYPNNNTNSYVITIEKGSKLDIETPTYGNKTFEGWYLDSNFNNPFDLNSSIYNNISIYAKWSDNETPPVSKGDIFVEPNGKGDGNSISDPTNLQNAINILSSGKTIYLLEGNYEFSNTITIEYGNNGTSSNYKTIKPYSNRVILNFSKQDFGSSNRGVKLDGNYWKIEGITIKNAGDNGMLLSGNYNIISNCIFERNKDTGLQLSRRLSSLSNIKDWPSYNQILNCTSMNNYDPDDGADADGFAAKLTCGIGNVFDGCIAYNNVDDGWDMYTKDETGKIGVVTIKNSIAFRNGFTEDNQSEARSNGNGFKLGGEGIAVKHIVENCIAFENRAHGFTDNNNPGGIILNNCTSFDNGMSGSKANFQFNRDENGEYKNLLSVRINTKSTSSDTFNGYLTNSIYYNSKKYYETIDKIYIPNSNYSQGILIDNPSYNVFESYNTPGINLDIHNLFRDSNNNISLGNLFKTKEYYQRFGANLA